MMTTPKTAYPKEVAEEVGLRRPDLTGVSALLMVAPTLTADEVIESLDDAGKDWADEQEYQESLREK